MSRINQFPLPLPQVFTAPQTLHCCTMELYIISDSLAQPNSLPPNNKSRPDSLKIKGATVDSGAMYVITASSFPKCSDLLRSPLATAPSLPFYLGAKLLPPE